MAQKRPADMDERKTTTQSNKNDDLYWHTGKSASESFSHLYENKQWTDVRIRCKGQVTVYPDDRLHAHKLILAARSPVFKAKFYGQTAWDSDELDMSRYNKESVDAFLRYIYNDTEVPIAAAVAFDVIKIAHMYQVKIRDWLGEIIRKGYAVNLENACKMLEISIRYELTSLRDNILQFIDNNAVAVLSSKGFLEISRDALEYLLRGDTLFTDERNIVNAAINWANNKLKGCNTKVNGRSIREVLGGAFSFLRMGTMGGSGFSEIEEKYCFHNREECLEIFSQITGRKGNSPRCILQSDKRVLRTTTTVFSEHTKSTERYNKSCMVELEISTRKDISVTQFILILPVIEVYYMANQSSFLIYVTTSCKENGFVQKSAIKMVGTCTSRQTITLNPPLNLPTKTTAYTLIVKIESPNIPNPNFKLAPISTKATGDCNNPSVNMKQNGLVASLTFRHHSSREENGKCGNIGDVQKAGSGNKRTKLDTADQG